MPHLSEKYLKSLLGLGDAPGTLIKDDRPCAGCGYNLKGLTFGRACPECGQTIQRTTEIGPPDDFIGRGAPDLRKRMQYGLGLAAGCLLFAIVARWLSLITAAFITGESSTLYHWGIFFNSVLWVVGVWLMTPRAIDRQWPRLIVLRWSVRLTQLFWPLALGADAILNLTTQTTMLENQLLGVQLFGRLIGGLGVLLLVWLMRIIAQGAELETASKRLSGVLWGLPLMTVIAYSFPDRFLWIYLSILALILVGWSWMMAWFALALKAMSQHAGWSIRYMHDQMDRDTRVLEKRAELQRESEQRIRPVSTHQDTDIPLDS